MQIPHILPPDESARAAAHAKWAACAHPLGGLGTLETCLEDIAALTGDPDLRLHPRRVLVLCADNGVVARGVSQSDHKVTAAVARGLAAGTTPVCRMAAVADCAVLPVDLGIRDFPGCPGVRNRRIRNGTEDIFTGPAMTRSEAEAAIQTGMDLVREQKEQGVRLLAVGEMGIGNTTTSAVLAAALLRLPADRVCGRGAGLSDEGLLRKQAVISSVLARVQGIQDPVELLCQAGGLDLAALCGVCLGGAVYRLPVILDGLITLCAAACAVRLAPACRQALIPSHLPAEPAGALLLSDLNLHPFLTAGLRLGEGTGAVALIPLLDMALAVYRQGATFEDRGMDPYVPWEEAGSGC